MHALCKCAVPHSAQRRVVLFAEMHAQFVTLSRRAGSAPSNDVLDKRVFRRALLDTVNAAHHVHTALLRNLFVFRDPVQGRIDKVIHVMVVASLLFNLP